MRFSTKEELRVSNWTTGDTWAAVSLNLFEQQAHCMSFLTYPKWHFKDAKGGIGMQVRDTSACCQRDQEYKRLNQTRRWKVPKEEEKAWSLVLWETERGGPSGRDGETCSPRKWYLRCFFVAKTPIWKETAWEEGTAGAAEHVSGMQTSPVETSHLALTKDVRQV